MADNEKMDGEQLKEVFASLVNVLKEQGMSQEELLGMYAGTQEINKDVVPVAIFATKLSPSESLCKYMKENLKFSYKKISGLINRDERSVWTSHNRSKEKAAQSFDTQTFKNVTLIPIKIFSDRKLSILEHVVLYLKEKTNDTNYKIAKTLNKAPSMIYTVYNRALIKIQPVKQVGKKR